MMNMSWMRIAVLALAATLSSSAFAATARAWLDRDSMQLGETVTLNVEVEGDARGEPDFSPLAGAFSLLGTQSSRQISLVNGRSTSKNLWAIGLEPRQAGTFTIPALTVGTLQTTPVTLTVAAAAAGAQAGQGAQSDDVFIEVSADPLAPYVQQQIRMVVKLHYAVDLTEGALDEPAVDGMVVQKLGRDRSYTANAGGKRYNVLERHYALIPERSGSITVPALAFRGSMLDRSDPTGFFRRGRAISARSEPIVFDVRAKPADWGSAAWLPAASLALSDQSELPSKIAVGEPVTRTVRILAQGLGYEQLPEIAFETPAGAEIYPDKAETQTRDDGTWLLGERTRKFAVVPTHPGTLTLPEVRVDWWDTAQQRRVSAVLPAHTIDVTGTAATAAATPAPIAAPVGAPQAAPAIRWPDAGAEGAAYRWRLAALAFAALWLITLVGWWRARGTRGRGPSDVSSKAEAPGRAAFRRACAIGDLAEAGRQLLAWARTERTGIRNLGELAGQLDDNAQRGVLADLERARFAGTGTEGLATRLGAAFRTGLHWRVAGEAAKDSPPLPPLYPGQP